MRKNMVPKGWSISNGGEEGNGGGCSNVVSFESKKERLEGKKKGRGTTTKKSRNREDTERQLLG